VKDPANYRWSSYGEAIGGGAKGNGQTARAGLVRALGAHKGLTADASQWAQGLSAGYRKLLMCGADIKKAESIGRDGKSVVKVLRKGISNLEAKAASDPAGEIAFSKMLHCRVRYFTEGAIIGSRTFVNDEFVRLREMFGENRRDGARKMKGVASAAENKLWSCRDLRKGIA